MIKLYRLACVGIFCCTAIADATATTTFTTIDFPGASITAATGVNVHGDVVGWYEGRNGIAGFLATEGSFTSIEVPHALMTVANAINDSKQIVGYYKNPESEVWGGFLFDGQVFTPINYPGGLATLVFGVNNGGTIVGAYNADSRKPHWHGFVYNAGHYATLDPTGDYREVQLFGISNSGAIVGEGVPHWAFRHRGLRYGNGAFKIMNVPDADATEARGLNDTGVVVGIYFPPGQQQTKCFAFAKGRFQHVAVPDAINIECTGINDLGQIVGFFTDSQQKEHGFLSRSQ